MALRIFHKGGSNTATARTGEPVPPRILSGRPMKRKRPRPTSRCRLIMFS